MLFSAAQWHFPLQKGALTGTPVTGKGIYYRRSAALTADSATELQRGDVQPQFVNETRRKVLTHNAGTASDPNIPAASGLVGLGECGLDPLGNEGESCATLHFHRFASKVGEDEHWRPIWWLGAPPALPGRIPCAASGAKHVAPQNPCSPDRQDRD